MGLFAELFCIIEMFCTAFSKRPTGFLKVYTFPPEGRTDHVIPPNCGVGVAYLLAGRVAQLTLKTVTSVRFSSFSLLIFSRKPYLVFGMNLTVLGEKFVI